MGSGREKSARYRRHVLVRDRRAAAEAIFTLDSNASCCVTCTGNVFVEFGPHRYLDGCSYCNRVGRQCIPCYDARRMQCFNHQQHLAGLRS